MLVLGYALIDWVEETMEMTGIEQLSGKVGIVRGGPGR
jgi:hypothetical protein